MIFLRKNKIVIFQINSYMTFVETDQFGIVVEI